MSRWNRQLRLLGRLGHETAHDDPGFAELLNQFTRLAASQPMPAHERVRTPLGRAWAAAHPAGAPLAGPSRALRRAAILCAIADRWLVARLPDAAPGWAGTGYGPASSRPGPSSATADLHFS